MVSPLTYCRSCGERIGNHVRHAVDRCGDWCYRRLRAVLRPPIEAVFEAQLTVIRKELLMDLQQILLIVVGALVGYYAVCHFLVAGRAA